MVLVRSFFPSNGKKIYSQELYSTVEKYKGQFGSAQRRFADLVGGLWGRWGGGAGERNLSEVGRQNSHFSVETKEISGDMYSVRGRRVPTRQFSKSMLRMERIGTGRSDEDGRRLCSTM